MFYSVLSAFFALCTMGFFLNYRLSDPEIRISLQNHIRGESDMAFAVTLCLGMVLMITGLILQHCYFILTSNCTIEYMMLMGVNPFFEGDRPSELNFIEN